MALHPIDRELLERCLAKKPGAWERFVDRFLGLVCHVIHHTARSRSLPLTDQDVEDLAAEVFLALLRDDFAVLRRFRGQSSLATYLTVIARRVVVRELLQRKTHVPLSALAEEELQAESSGPSEEQRWADREEVQRLLSELPPNEAAVVRLFHLEGKSYEEISAETGMPVNSIGPTLYRARHRMKNLVRAAEGT
ncbi:MAG: RNA polymerase sigma factor [Pirellulaceae bacterium]|nr:MAG: RNA polymerase sigma factor [Pirellulaceae bacterium]